MGQDFESNAQSLRLFRVRCAGSPGSRTRGRNKRSWPLFPGLSGSAQGACMARRPELGTGLRECWCVGPELGLGFGARLEFGL